MADFLINIRGNATQFGSEAQKAIGKLNSLASTALMSAARGLLPFLTVGGAIAFTRNTMAWADQLENLSLRTQVNVETLQELEHAARITGTSLNSYVDAIRDITRAQANAAAGQERFAAAFGTFGISLAELSTLNPEQLFRRIGDSMKGAELTSRQITDALTLMGQQASQLIPSMVTGIDTFADSARRAGIVVKEDLVKQLAAANAEWATLMSQAKAAGAPWVRRMLMMVDFNKELLGNLPQYFSRQPGAAHGIWSRLMDIGFKWGIGGAQSLLNPPSGTTGTAATDPLEETVKNAVATSLARDQQPGNDAMARSGLFTTSFQHIAIARRSLQIQQQTLAEHRVSTSEIRNLQRTLDNLL